MSPVVKQLACRARASALALILLLGTTSGFAREYVLATASPGGTYYPVGTAIATLVKAQLSQEHGIEMVAIPTAGSVENVALLEQGKADFAILQALIVHDAWTGRRFSEGKPRRGLRAVSALWANVEQFVVRTEHVRSGTIDDLLLLKGAAVAFGAPDSGTLFSNRILLSHLGTDIDREYRLIFLGYGPAADALQAGEVAAVSLPAGLPTRSLTRIRAAMGPAATILRFTPEQARRADGGLGLWSQYTIAAGTYPGQTDDIPTIAQPNLLVVSANVDASAVYQVARTLYTSRDFLGAIHSATDAIRLENALEGVPVPLHAGALRYFREAGLEVPAHLVGP